jgi:hypothetical protein
MGFMNLTIQNLMSAASAELSNADSDVEIVPPVEFVASNIPTGFLNLSVGIHKLVQGMWGGLIRPEPVRRLKRECPKLSIGFESWRQLAAESLTAAVLKGDLPVYVLGPRLESRDPTFKLSLPLETEPVHLSTNVLKRLVTVRQAIPDAPIRPTLQTADGDRNLLEPISKLRIGADRL